MAYEVCYQCDFNSSPFEPSVNTNGWRPLQLSSNAPRELIAGSTRRARLGVERPQTATMPAICGLLVAPTSLAAGSRFRVRLWFDRVQGEGFDANGQLVPIDDIGASSGLTSPEDWEVGSSIGKNNDLNHDPTTQVDVMCRISNLGAGNGGSAGVKTSGTLENGGEVITLMQILRYPLLADTLFKLEHVFNGMAVSVMHPYTLGSGLLRYFFHADIDEAFHAMEVPVAYSTNVFQNPSAPIGALGVTLMTEAGVGRISVRLRRFEISILTP